MTILSLISAILIGLRSSASMRFLYSCSFLKSLSSFSLHRTSSSACRSKNSASFSFLFNFLDSSLYKWLTRATQWWSRSNGRSGFIFRFVQLCITLARVTGKRIDLSVGNWHNGSHKLLVMIVRYRDHHRLLLLASKSFLLWCELFYHLFVSFLNAQDWRWYRNWKGRHRHQW